MILILDKIMLKMVGTSGQISLGKQFAGLFFELEHRKDGGLLLKPMKVIPAGEEWLHTPEMQKKLRAAESWAKKHPPKATDVEAFLAKAAKKIK